ncbi:MAG: hypothetical protein LBJ94_02545 [Puniceicoccales bacterium]|jgi:hypothetical protein|nr:hypothetical protein [Puniceicoccales bacterium]
MYTTQSYNHRTAKVDADLDLALVLSFGFSGHRTCAFRGTCYWGQVIDCQKFLTNASLSHSNELGLGTATSANIPQLIGLPLPMLFAYPSHYSPENFQFDQNLA